MRRAGMVSCIVVAFVLVGGHASAANVYGTNGPDANLSGTGLADNIFGRAGNDQLFADGSAFDNLHLGAGRDTATGGPQKDFVIDDDGKATKREKPDQLALGAGDDVIYSADGESDQIDCGSGANDIAFGDVNDAYTGCEVVIAFAGENGSGYIFDPGTKDGDSKTGTSGQDFIAGKNGNDVIHAGDSDDYLLGGKGSDELHGEAGGDAIYDDDSKSGDTLLGGDGVDYIFSADGGADTIDCGASDGDNDVVFMDAEDTKTNCELDTHHIAPPLGT